MALLEQQPRIASYEMARFGLNRLLFFAAAAAAAVVVVGPSVGGASWNRTTDWNSISRSHQTWQRRRAPSISILVEINNGPTGTTRQTLDAHPMNVRTDPIRSAETRPNDVIVTVTISKRFGTSPAKKEMSIAGDQSRLAVERPPLG